VPVYQEIKDVMTKLCLQLFLGLESRSADNVARIISDLATKHWHGLQITWHRIHLLWRLNFCNV